MKRLFDKICVNEMSVNETSVKNLGTPHQYILLTKIYINP